MSVSRSVSRYTFRHSFHTASTLGAIHACATKTRVGQNNKTPYNGIDHFSHGFMHYHPPRMEGIPEDKFEIYKDIINGAYRFHDMMLQTLLDRAGPDTTLCSFLITAFTPITFVREPFPMNPRARPYNTADSESSA